MQDDPSTNATGCSPFPCEFEEHFTCNVCKLWRLPQQPHYWNLDTLPRRLTGLQAHPEAELKSQTAAKI